MQILLYSLKALWFFGPGVLTIVLSYVLFSNSDAGKDVIILASESTPHVLLSVLCLFAWGYFLWYSSRLLSYERMADDRRWPVAVLTHFPRLVAVNAYISIIVAIAHLTEASDLHFPTLLLVVLGMNGLYFVLAYFFGRKKGGTVGWIVFFAFILLIPFVVPFTPPQANHIPSLLVLCIEITIVLIGFIIFVIQRRDRIESYPITDDPCERDVEQTGPTGYPQFTFLALGPFKLVKVPVYQNEKKAFRIFNIVAVLLTIIFVSTFCSLHTARTMGPAPVAMLGFGFLAGGFNLMNMFSLRFKFNIFLPLLWIAWLVGAAGKDPYEVPLTNSPSPHYFNKRITYDRYFRDWVNKRAALIKDSPKGYPVYLIIADGGASRSGYWVASVLGAWEDRSITMHPSDHFSEHLICLSGASGGSVGNATFYSLLKFNQQKPTYRKRAQAFLSDDFLSSTLAHYMGPDLIRHILPFLPFSDRAGALADGLSKSAEDLLYSSFSQNTSSILENSADLPALFLGSTSVQGGLPAVVSSIKLTGFSQRIDILGRIDSLKNNEGKHYDIPFGVATILSARFPYLSPAGKIGNDYYVDGGYFDNSGAGVVQEFLGGIQKVIWAEKDSSLCSLFNNLRFKVIHITNTPKSNPVKPINPLMNDLATPILTVLGTYGSQTNVNDQRLNNLMIQINPLDSKNINVNLYVCKDSADAYPMNWVISKFRRDKMNKRVDQVAGMFD